MAQTIVAPDLLPSPRRWTREAYLQLAEAGFLGPEPRTELIDGQIVEKMSQGNAHILAVKLAFWALHAAYGEGYDISMQTSLPLGKTSMPEPDVVVLRGAPRDYDGHDPDPVRDVALVVEVSDSTLTFDRGTKVGLYARHGVPEVWIVDLRHRTVELRRRPLDEGYAETRVYIEGESVPVSSTTIAVAELLPKVD